MDKPALVSPAGDMERLKMALHYGANAVYLAGSLFGMRAAAGNFSDGELALAIELAHSYGAEAYVTVNTLPRENELQKLPEFLQLLSDVRADAVIVSDIGVMSLAKKYAPDVRIHISTQFGVTNSAAASTLYELGAESVVLARELSLDEIAEIREKTPKALRLEVFVHGSMCVSFSGRCLLSDYMTGRSANRGECAQPCRWKYHLVEEKRPGEFFEISEDGGTHILNSRDLCMIAHLPQLLKTGVSALKIEGRQKSAYYAAVVTNAYRHALDAALEGRRPEKIWLSEVNNVSHREYCTGFYFGDPGQHNGDSLYIRDRVVLAVVECCDKNGYALLSQRNKFFNGDTVELLTNDHGPAEFIAEDLCDESGERINCAPHPMMRLRMKLPFYAAALSIIRSAAAPLENQT